MSASSTTSDYVIQYPFPSSLSEAGLNQRLELAPALIKESQYFFEGRLLRPRIAASMLVLLPKLATTRFHVPPNMLAQILSLADPVVTCGRDIIRLESFSACGSAYARMDIDSNACVGEFLGKGTTNVDFQQGLRDALAALNMEGELGMAIGKAEVKLSVGSEHFVERKVKLPTRWIRGFAEVSAYQSKMNLVHDVSKVPAIRFLQTFATSSVEKEDYFVVFRKGELSLTQQKQADAVKLAGTVRLKLLKSLMPFIDRLRIYSDPNCEASSWLIDAGPYRFEFVISAATYRGFSGEGQVLSQLAKEGLEKYLPSVRSSLNWQTKIQLDELASTFDTTLDVARACLQNLGSGGLVGYDCSSTGYYHRELPFKAGQSISLNPRLRGAKEIIDGELIEIVDTNSEFVEAHVSGSGVMHVVRSTANDFTCTCVWFAKNQGKRGPCKHILSLQILMERTNAT